MDNFNVDLEITLRIAFLMKRAMSNVSTLRYMIVGEFHLTNKKQIINRWKDKKRGIIGFM